MIVMPCASYESTEESRAMVESVVEVLDELNLKLDAVAAYVGLPFRYVSDSLTNKRPLAFWRFYMRVPGFKRTFLEMEAKKSGCLLLDRDLVSMVVQVDERKRMATIRDLTRAQKRTA